jgi:DNA-binding transcriptional LysR family regulator
LEQWAGTQLVLRSRAPVALTPAGERLVVRARELLALADDALQDIRSGEDGAAGALCVAAPQSLCAALLAPLGARLARTLPALRLAIQECNSADTADAVRQGSVQLGLVHGRPRDEAGLHIEVIARDQPVAVMAEGHPLAAHDAVPLHALAATPLVATSAGCRYRDYLDTLLLQADEPPTIRAEADGVPSLLRMVHAGLGAAVLPRRSIDAGWAARLALRPLAAAADGLPICLLTRAGSVRSPALAALIDSLQQAASDEAVAALDMEHGARGVAIAHEEQHGVRDVPGAAHAADGQPGRHLGQ